MKWLKALLVPLVVAAAGTAIMPAPAFAGVEPTCYWYAGKYGMDSNCDGKDYFYASACETGSLETPLSQNIGLGVVIHLQYVHGSNGGCQSVRAHMFINGAVPPGSNCYVKVVRNYDGKTLYTSVRIPGDSDEYQWTNILYDAGPTSYAWGYCYRPGYGTVSGGTGSY